MIGEGAKAWAVLLWLAFLLLAPLPLFALKNPLLRLTQRLPARLRILVEEIERGLPADPNAFMRAWGATVVNWGIKVVVLAWVLRLMDVSPLAASFGGALGGELSSVLPVHAPGGVGTYPAGIVAGAVSFGAATSPTSLALIGKAAVNAPSADPDFGLRRHGDCGCPVADQASGLNENGGPWPPGSLFSLIGTLSRRSF